MTRAPFWRKATARRALGFGGIRVELPRGVHVITARQARAARSVLDLSMSKLAECSGMSESSIRRIEDDKDKTVKLDLILRLQKYFETQGVTFLWESDEAGVKWLHGKVPVPATEARHHR